MSDRELLPCPFCGGEPIMRTVDERGPNFGAQFIECSRCQCSTYLMFPLMDSVDRQLIEKWNSRIDARLAEPEGDAGRLADYVQACKDNRTAFRWTDADADMIIAALRSAQDGRVSVPREVLEFYQFADMVFVPFTSQGEELQKSLARARKAMLAASQKEPT